MPNDIAWRVTMEDQRGPKVQTSCIILAPDANIAWAEMEHRLESHVGKDRQVIKVRREPDQDGPWGSVPA